VIGRELLTWTVVSLEHYRSIFVWTVVVGRELLTWTVVSLEHCHSIFVWSSVVGRELLTGLLSVLNTAAVSSCGLLLSVENC